jgi:uncharacterized protein
MAHRFRRLDLFVTEACNLACPYCFARRGPPRSPLALQDALRAVDWLQESNDPRVHITFWGGEPLLRLDLLRRVSAHARDAAQRVGKTLTLSMPTNGTLLDEEAVAWLSEQRVQVFCSVDGAGEGRPVAVDGRDSYPLALQGLRRARALGAAARITVTPENAARHAEAVLDLVAEGVGELPTTSVRCSRAQRPTARSLPRWREVRATWGGSTCA